LTLFDRLLSQLNIASLVNIVLAIGFSVDYSAHIAEAFSASHISSLSHAVCMCIVCARAHAHVRVHMHMCACTCICARVRACLPACLPACPYACARVRVLMRHQSKYLP